MATVDTLLVKIEADLSGLRQDLKRVERTTRQSSNKMKQSLNGIDSSFQKIGRTAKALAPILAGALGVGAVRSFIRVGSQVENLRVRLRFLFGDVEEGAKAFDVMARFASRVPFSLQEIQNASGTLASVANNANELNELLKITGNVAAVSGLSFEAAAGNLQRAFSAGANSADLFRERGILALAGFEAGAKVTVDETVKKFQEAFGSGGQFDGATEELASTFTGTMSMLGDAVFNFQRQVVDAGLLDAFKDLVEFLRENVAETQRLAQVIGRALAAAVRGVTKALDFLLENLNAVIIAIAIFASIKTIAAITAIGVAFVSLATDVLKAGTALKAINKILKRSPIFILAVVMAAVLESTGALGAMLDKVKGKFDELFPPIEETDQAAKNLTSTIKDLAGTLSGNAVKAPEEFTKTIQNLKDETKKAKAELAGMKPALISALDAAGGLSNISPDGRSIIRPKDEKEANQLGVTLTGQQITELEKLVAAEQAAASALELRNKQIDEAKAVVAGLITEEERLTETLNSLQVAFDNGKISMDEFKAAKQAIQEQIQALDPMFQTLRSAVQTMSSQVSSAFADMVMSGQINMSSLQDIFKNFVKTMIAKAIELMVINKIMNAAFGLTGANALPTASIPFFAGGGKIPARAGGGPVLVGERGPELFIPSSAGIIRNNHDSMNMLGGANQPVVNQTINVTTGVAQTVRAEVMSMIPRIKSETISAMIDGKKRGNAISKAFG